MRNPITFNQQERDADIYRAYVTARNEKKTVDWVAKEFGITRTAVYDSIKRVKLGNTAMILKCLKDCRNEALWTHKYKSRFCLLPVNRKFWTIAEVTELIKNMKTDGFSQGLIAEKLGLSRSTVEHHLNKKVI